MTTDERAPPAASSSASGVVKENSAPQKALSKFAMVPRRAFSDPHMKARHLKVLGAICVAVDPETATALISQKRIGHHAGMARQKVPAVIADLEELGYISRIKRGRSQPGRFKTNIYEISYIQEDALNSRIKSTHSTHGGDAGLVIHGGGNTVSPAGVAESYLQRSNLCSFFKPSERKVDRSSAPNSPAGGMKKPRTQEDRTGPRAQLAKARAETWERTETNKASKRLCAALLNENPSGEWLEQLSQDQLDAATRAEQFRPGAGIRYVQVCVKNRR